MIEREQVVAYVDALNAVRAEIVEALELHQKHQDFMLKIQATLLARTKSIEDALDVCAKLLAAIDDGLIAEDSADWWKSGEDPPYES